MSNEPKWKLMGMKHYELIHEPTGKVILDLISKPDNAWESAKMRVKIRGYLVDLDLGDCVLKESEAE